MSGSSFPRARRQDRRPLRSHFGTWLVRVARSRIGRDIRRRRLWKRLEWRGHNELPWSRRPGCDGFTARELRQFWMQLAGATLCAAWAFGATYLVFTIVNTFKSIRVTEEVEQEGLDVPEFGMTAYPEDALVTVD